VRTFAQTLKFKYAQPPALGLPFTLVNNEMAPKQKRENQAYVHPSLITTVLL